MVEKNGGRNGRAAKPRSIVSDKLVKAAPGEGPTAQSMANGANGASHVAPKRASAPSSMPPTGKGKSKDRKEVRELLNHGQNKGFLTYDEVNDALPPEVTSEQIDELMMILSDEEIEVVDHPSNAKVNKAPRMDANGQKRERAERERADRER